MTSFEPLRKIQEKLTAEKMDGLLVTHLPSIFYLTGFTGSAATLLIRQRSSLFLTDGRYMEQAAEQVKKVRIVRSKKGFLQDAAESILRSGIKQVGFESRHLSHDQFRQLKRMIGKVSRLIPCLDWVEQVRIVKTPAEVEKIQASLETVTDAFDEMLPMIRPGIREREISAELEYRMKQHGAQKVSFDLIVASGIRSALPHGIASEKKVHRNEFLVFDLGAILNGYSSDFTRTVYVGRPPAKAREIYRIVRESQENAIAGIRDGVAASHIDYLARNTIRKQGYGKYFIHSTGHGIGVEVHEAPLISARSTAVLKAGHVVTIEPGIYLPQYGGVRIEDIVVVTEGGCRNLTGTNKDLIIL